MFMYTVRMYRVLHQMFVGYIITSLSEARSVTKASYLDLSDQFNFGEFNNNLSKAASGQTHIVNCVISDKDSFNVIIDRFFFFTELRLSNNTDNVVRKLSILSIIDITPEWHNHSSKHYK